MSNVRLTIDGQAVTAGTDETVLEAALRHGITIPHLCTHPNLPPFGACRICLVEIDGMKGFPTSCTTPAADGMVVRTNTRPLIDLRREILELIMVEHPSACLVCDKRELCEKYRPKADKAGAASGCHACNNKEICEIRQLADELGLSELPVPPFYRDLPVDRSDPFIDRDMNLCILCGRCVRICSHLHGTAVIDFVSRGSSTLVGTAFGRSLIEASCRFCGACIDVCPTGSLADRYAKWHGKPQTLTETTCIFCDAACAVTVAANRNRAVQAAGINGDIPICLLGRFAIPAFLNALGRLDAPGIRTDHGLRYTDWQEALKAAGEKLKAFKGGVFAMVCDTTSTLEDRHVFRKFTADVMGSPHYIELAPDSRGRACTELPKGVKAAFLTGGFVDRARLDDLELLILQDCHTSPTAERADFVFPVAVFAEVDGTFIDAGGVARPLHKACEPPGQARSEWRIVADLAQAMGAEGFTYASTEAITREAGCNAAELLVAPCEAPAAARDPRDRRTHFRGHRIDEKVPELKRLPAGDVAAKQQTG